MMTKELKLVDISNVPELVRLAQEVKAANEPRILQSEGEDIALLMPVTSTSKRHKKARSESDYEAFLDSAGGWRELVDTEELKENIYESRRISSRPPITL